MDRASVRVSFTAPASFTTRPQLEGSFGFAASTHWLATAAAQAMLERGGNAFDAVVAGGFVLHVVEPHLNGPGGDLVGLFRPAGQAPAVLMGQGPAPAAATIDHFRAEGLDLVPDVPDGAVPTVTTGGQAAAPQNAMRKAFKTNDLRNWAPQRPVMLCGGNADPTVFYSVNTALMQGLWSAPSPLALPAGLLTVLDVDSAASAGDPFAAVKAGFAQAKAGLAAQGGASAVVQGYHTTVAPFCSVAARAFFQQVLASGG